MPSASADVLEVFPPEEVTTQYFIIALDNALTRSGKLACVYINSYVPNLREPLSQIPLTVKRYWETQQFFLSDVWVVESWSIKPCLDVHKRQLSRLCC